MRYAEAIREGIKRIPFQVHGYAGIAEFGQGCVHSTALFAAGKTWAGPVGLHFPDIDGRLVKCPAGNCVCSEPSLLVGIAIHLNDFHRWTREAIADWVDQVVPPPAPEPPPLIALMDQSVKEEERELVCA